MRAFCRRPRTFWTFDREASAITPRAFSGGGDGASIDQLFITHAANDTLIDRAAEPGRL